LRENIAGRLLIILGPLGLKPIAKEDVMLHFIGYSTGGGPAQHWGHRPSVTSQNLSQGCKDSLKCWDGEVSTTFWFKDQIEWINQHIS